MRSTAVDQVLGGRVGDEVVEVEPHPARLDPEQPRSTSRCERVRPGRVDAEQAVAVRAGARAAAARLDAEQVVEQGHDEVVVQVPVAVPDAERHDRQPRRVEVAEELDVADWPASAAGRTPRAVPRARRITSVPTASLSAKTSPARIDSTIAGVPPSSRVTGSARYRWSVALTYATVPPPGTVGTRLVGQVAARRRARRASAGRRRTCAARGRRRPCGRRGPGALSRDPDRQRTARRPRSPRRTVRRAGAAARRPASASVRMPVTLEAAEKLPIRSGRSAYRRSSLGEVREVDAAVGVRADHHDVGERLAPRQLVGVVLVRPDEDHRPVARPARGRGGRTTGRAGRAAAAPGCRPACRPPPVTPEPQKITACSSVPPDRARG